jgi:hypothetical protein
MVATSARAKCRHQGSHVARIRSHGHAQSKAVAYLQQNLLLDVTNSDLHRQQSHLAVGGQLASLATQKVQPPLERCFPYPVASSELGVGLARPCLVLVNDLRPKLASSPFHAHTLRALHCPRQDVSDRTVTAIPKGMAAVLGVIGADTDLLASATSLSLK